MNKDIIKHDETLKRYIKHDDDVNQFYAPPGKEHYALLSYISHQYNNTILYDLGTFKGLSALALSSNPSNKVVSYDLDWFVDIHKPNNVEFRVGDFYSDPEMLKSPLIVFDIDCEDGLVGKKFMEYLQKNNYKGVVICDDINFVNNSPPYGSSKGNYWHELDQEKYDYSEMGHWSGTGVVVFNAI